MEIFKEAINNQQYNLALLLGKTIKDEYNNNCEFRTLYSTVLANIDNNLLNMDDKNEINRKTRVMLMCNWCSSEDLCKLWNKMSKNNNFMWDNIQIVWRQPCDYYCIINKPLDESIEFDKSRTIIFQMEPHMEKQSDYWGEWVKPNKDDFLFVGNHTLHYNNVEWHLSYTYQQLLETEIKKNENICNVLSTILSDKYSDPGHIKRIDFVKFLEKKGLDVDVYGGNRFMWKNYKGTLPYHCKDESLFPYKYCFNVENHEITNYFTEKIVDGILAECLVFYSGCFNVKDYIDSRAYMYLELSNFEKDYEIIKNAIENNLWEERLPYIRAAKKKILNELQFFPRLDNIISSNDK